MSVTLVAAVDVSAMARVDSFAAEVWACTMAVVMADADCCAIRMINRPAVGLPFLSANDRTTSELRGCRLY